MKLLALISLCGALYTFVMALFNTAIDPDKGLNAKMQMANLDTKEKRMRFVWFAVGALPTMALAIVYLVTTEWTLVDFVVLAVLVTIILFVFDRVRQSLRPTPPGE